MQMSLQLLRDGYLVEPTRNRSIKVTARTRYGTATRWISADELREKGVDAIVAELRQRADSGPAAAG